MASRNATIHKVDYSDNDSFLSLSAKLQELTGDHDGYSSHTGFTVLVDHVNLLSLNPIGAGRWETLIAMLILAFPEFRWIFGAFWPFAVPTQRAEETEDQKVLRDTAETAETIRSSHGIGSLFQASRSPIFDGYGLRQFVRKLAKTPRNGDKSVAGYLPDRKEVACAIDDETSYAFFHAYAAYRFGFRSDALTTQATAIDLLSDAGKRDTADSLDLSLTIEDLYLNFPDRTSDVSLSDLEKRNSEFPALKCTSQRQSFVQVSVEVPVSKERPVRVFVTTGQEERGGEGRDKALRNRNALLQMRARGQLGTICYKPTGGIFGLWEESGLMRTLHGEGKQGLRGYAPGFIWPPDPVAPTDKVRHGHSAPGKLLEISNHLRARAERILSGSLSVEDSILAAVLATDALELLGERTPTSALEALALKHRAEVTAECQFYGTRFHLSIEPRLKELHAEVQRIGEWFSPKIKDEANANAELGILCKLAAIFREHALFDEEQTCLVRVRVLHRQLWFGKHPWHFPAWPVQWYADFLLASFPRFMLVILGWLIGLGLLFCLGGDLPGQGFQHGVTSFLSIGQPFHAPGATAALPTSSTWGYFAVMALSLVGGVFHLGVFINHLYTISSRR